MEHGTYPSVSEIRNRLSCFRDLIAYRSCDRHAEVSSEEWTGQRKRRRKISFEIANALPEFLGGARLYSGTNEEVLWKVRRSL